MQSLQSSHSATRSRSFSTTTLISKLLTRAICRLQTLFSESERKIVGRAGSPLHAVHISLHGAHGVTRPTADFFCLQRPIASRSARSRGRPAFVIFFCAVARSYFTRNSSTRLLSTS